VLPIEIREQVEQIGVSIELAPVTLAELGPTFNLVAEPLPQLGGRRDVSEAEVSLRHRARKAARPEPVHEDTIPIA
jgi:hypothetical protein